MAAFKNVGSFVSKSVQIIVRQKITYPPFSNFSLRLMSTGKVGDSSTTDTQYVSDKNM